MKQNTDIERFRHKSPFRVPENYFPKLKRDIQFKTENIGSVLEFKFLNYFNIKNLTSGLVSACVILIIYNYVNNSVSKFDNLDVEVYTQFIEFEIENIDEEYFLEFLPEEEYAFTDEIEYLLENDIYFNQIIN